MGCALIVGHIKQCFFILSLAVVWELDIASDHWYWEDVESLCFSVPECSDPHVVPCKDEFNFHIDPLSFLHSTQSFDSDSNVSASIAFDGWIMQCGFPKPACSHL